MSDTFTNLINSLPFAPRTSEGRGLLPPLIRTIGHLLYTAAAMSETRCEVMTDAEFKTEVAHARTHADGISEDALANLSRASAAHLRAFRQALAACEAEWDTTERATRIDRLQLLAHRATGIASLLDRELIGLGSDDTDPGRSL